MSEVSNKYMLSGFFVKFGTAVHQTGQIIVQGEFYLPFAPIAIVGSVIWIKGFGHAKIKDVYYIVDKTQNLPDSYTQNTILFAEIDNISPFDGSLTCSSPSAEILGFDLNQGEMWVNLNNIYNVIYLYESVNVSGPFVLVDSLASPGTPGTGIYNVSLGYIPVYGRYYKIKGQDCQGNFIDSNVFNFNQYYPTTALQIDQFEIALKAIDVSYTDIYSPLEIWESIDPNFAPFTLKNTFVPGVFPSSGSINDWCAGTLNLGYWYYITANDVNGNPVSTIPQKFI